MRAVVFILGTTIVFIEWGMRIINIIINNKTNTSSPRPLRVIVTAWTISWTVPPKKARTGIQGDVRAMEIAEREAADL